MEVDKLDVSKLELIVLLKRKNDIITYLLERFEGAEYDDEFIKELESITKEMDKKGLISAIVDLEMNNPELFENE